MTKPSIYPWYLTETPPRLHTSRYHVYTQFSSFSDISTSASASSSPSYYFSPISSKQWHWTHPGVLSRSFLLHLVSYSVGPFCQQGQGVGGMVSSGWLVDCEGRAEFDHFEGKVVNQMQWLMAGLLLQLRCYGILNRVIYSNIFMVFGEIISAW